MNQLFCCYDTLHAKMTLLLREKAHNNAVLHSKQGYCSPQDDSVLSISPLCRIVQYDN